MDPGSEMSMGREKDNASRCIERAWGPEKLRRILTPRGKREIDEKGQADSRTVFSIPPQAGPAASR